MIFMQEKVEEINEEVINLDKQLTLLSHDYQNIAEAFKQTNEQLQDTNKLLNKLCTKFEKQNVVVDSLQSDVKRFQQYVYGIAVAVIAFVIQQVIMMLH